MLPTSSSSSSSSPCSRSVLRVIGPDLPVLERLRSSLSSHFGSCGDSDNRSNDGDSGKDEGIDDRRRNSDSRGESSSSSSGLFLKVSNRYFDAQVGMLGLSDPLNDPETHKEDGVLLVVAAEESPSGGHDSSTRSSSPSPSSSKLLRFDALDDLHGTAEAEGKAGDLLRLCLVVSKLNAEAEPAVNGSSNENAGDDEKEEEEEYSRRILWCLDRGYEYVDGVDLSTHGVRRGHDERDKEGFARVVEAIATTVWSSAVMRKSARQQLRSSYQQDKQSIVAGPGNPDRGIDDADGPDECGTYQPPDPIMMPQAPPPATSQGGGSPESDHDREERLLLQQEADERRDTGTNAELGNEVYFDRFEGALREAGRIRDLSRSGVMSDEDRRKRAGDAAVLLMDLMNKMGAGLDDDDDDEGEGDEGSACDPEPAAESTHPE